MSKLKGMPLLRTSFCVGNGSQPCRFSTERLGFPRLCVYPATQCLFCDGSTMRRGLHILLRPLACLYIQDADLYREALQRVSEDSRGRARFLVRRALEMMSPMGIPHDSQRETRKGCMGDRCAGSKRP